MFEWMFEGHWAGYAVLVALALIFLMTWWRGRKLAFLYAFAGCLALIVGYTLLDWAVESDREQIARKLTAMGKAVKDRKPDVIVGHLSDEFHYGTMDKKAFEAKVAGAIGTRLITDLIVWDFQFPSEGRTERIRPVHFRAKPIFALTGDQAPFFSIRSHFIRDADGQWRLKDFKAFDPTNLNNEIVIPDNL